MSAQERCECRYRYMGCQADFASKGLEATHEPTCAFKPSKSTAGVDLQRRAALCMTTLRPRYLRTRRSVGGLATSAPRFDPTESWWTETGMKEMLAAYANEPVYIKAEFTIAGRRGYHEFYGKVSKVTKLQECDKHGDDMCEVPSKHAGPTLSVHAWFNERGEKLENRHTRIHANHEGCAMYTLNDDTPRELADALHKFGRKRTRVERDEALPTHAREKHKLIGRWVSVTFTKLKAEPGEPSELMGANKTFFAKIKKYHRVDDEHLLHCLAVDSDDDSDCEIAALDPIAEPGTEGDWELLPESRHVELEAKADEDEAARAQSKAARATRALDEELIQARQSGATWDAQVSELEAAIAAQKEVLEITRKQAATAQKRHAAALQKRKRTLIDANERVKRSKKKKLAAQLAQVAQEEELLREKKREIEQAMSHLDGAGNTTTNYAMTDTETAQ